MQAETKLFIDRVICIVPLKASSKFKYSSRLLE